MELITWLPIKFFYLLAIAGAIAAVVVYRMPLLPNKDLIALAAVLASVFGVYCVGIVHNNQSWQARVDKLQAKVAAAEAKSQQVNVEIRDRIVVKTNTIREQAKTITEYVDREIVKYDNRCDIPQEVTTTHNKAAHLPK
jgi:hypothetical protein